MHLSLSLLLLPVLVFASVTPNFVRAPSALARSQTGSVPCQTACVSASDTSGITTIASCPTDPASANTACVCSAAATLSSACLDCFLGLDNISESEFSQACAAGGAGGSGGSTTPTSTASTPSGSASPYCTSVCTSASDQAGEANLQVCAFLLLPHSHRSDRPLPSAMRRHGSQLPLHDRRHPLVVVYELLAWYCGSHTGAVHHRLCRRRQQFSW
ncbi:hypothetical protein CALCODRAFT_492832 [Calocera cornea HHB12733]|uniref:Extracellular membrane protein CFEM domain-containing protein n=1 Tax=Calocera cornea HHB12733 TaxID=1353952 RepID=A0A165I2X7_9BASI|nr:hypothetical protein CALCODRAFT_492832 [Calocera cornea HHB12733]